MCQTLARLKVDTKVDTGNFAFLDKRPTYRLLSSGYSRMAEYPFASMRNLRKWRSKSHCDMWASGGLRYFKALLEYISRVIWSVTVARIHLCFWMSESLSNRVIYTCAFGCILCTMSHMKLVDALRADMRSGQD